VTKQKQIISLSSMRQHHMPHSANPGSSHGRLATSLLTAFVIALLPSQIRAAESSPTAVDSALPSVPETDLGPERLKQQVQVTVETNALPAGPTTNAVPLKEKSFRWKFSWEGWNGLHSELSQRTPIQDPLAAMREKIQGTNAYRVFHLEQLKMSGTIGAKLALDAAAYVTGQQFQDFNDGVEVRRARVYAKGDCLLLLPVSYELEVGYIPNQFYIENSYLLFRNIPWIGGLKIGQYQAPMSLDMITSSRDLTFMEPAAPLQALAPGVNAGIEIGRPVLDQRATWRVGLFTDGVGQDFGDATKDYGRAILRLTGLPIYRPNPDLPYATRLLHLGVSANVLYSASSSVRYRSRPESHLAPYVIDTEDMAADGALVLGVETAWVNGPFSVQAEYLHSSVRQNNGQIPDFNGFYASASWFLTGESRPYDRTEGIFGRVIPKRNFDFGRGGSGVWEIAARYSFVNLDSADIHGGRLSELMLSLNWYLHPHVKWRFDYGLGHVSGRQPEGNINIFQTRVEFDL
jgi:phosphate-selective porin OprO and OprP